MGDFHKGKRFSGGKGNKKFDGKRDFGRRSFGDDRGGNRSFGGDRGRDRERPKMFSAVCSDCGKQCEVPFRPSGDKPVLCSDCFRNKKGDNSRNFRDRGKRDFGERNQARFDNTRSFQKDTGRGGKNYKTQFEMLNTKLDKILKAITPVGFAETKKTETPVFKKAEKTPKKEVKTAVLKKTLAKVLTKKSVSKTKTPKTATKTTVKKPTAKKSILKKTTKKKK